MHDKTAEILAGSEADGKRFDDGVSRAAANVAES